MHFHVFLAKRLARLSPILMLLLLPGCHQNISGSYLARDKTTVLWIQLVRTSDNRVTGQLAASTLKPDGSINREAISLTGAVDEENVTLSGSGSLGLASFTLGGTFEGNRLTLAGGQFGSIVFTRSTLAAYQKGWAELDANAQQINKAKADAEARQRANESQLSFVAGIDSLIRKMDEFDSAANVHLQRFPGAEKGYQEITAKVAAYVARERQFAGNPNASNTRVQLSNAAIQASNLTEQMHYQGLSLESSMNGTIKPLADQATSFEQGCQSVASNSRNLTPEEAPNVHAACDRLAAAVGPFREKYNAMSAGLADLEQVYQREKNAQQKLIDEAGKLN